MKVIDLLNKIANGEELPKKIKYNDEIWEYYKDLGNYIRAGKPNTLFTMYYIHQILNDEIEVIEEDKEIKKLEVYQQITANGNEHNYINYNGSKYAISTPQRLIIENQNKLIKEVNKLKNKLF